MTLGDEVKYSTDTEFIKSEIKKRICKGGDKQRKGGGQLLHSINAIINNDILSTKDQQSSKVDIFFPIIVTTDKAFSAMGVNKIILKEFKSLYNKYNLKKTHISPVVIIDYDTLFLLCKRLHDNVLDLEKLIVEYTSLLINSTGGIDFNISFYTYIYEKYRLSESDEIENNFLFGDLFDDTI